MEKWIILHFLPNILLSYLMNCQSGVHYRRHYETLKIYQICQRLGKNEEKPCSTCFKPFFWLILGTPIYKFGYQINHYSKRSLWCTMGKKLKKHHHDFLKYRIDTTAYGTIPSNFDPLFDGKRPFHKSEILFLSSSFNKKNQNMFWLDKIKFCQLCFLHCNNEQFKIWSFIHP